MKKKAPSYRHRKGSEQAVVTLSDARTKKRRDYWLGPYGSPESYERYYRILAEWEAGKRTLPTIETERAPSADGIKVFEVIHAYWSYAREHYEPSEAGCIRVAGRLLRQFYGQTPAVEFGPKKLRFLREQMISGDENIDPPRPSWSRVYINQQIKRIRRMFKWAVSHEMLPVAVAQQLATIEPLKRGRSNARENEPVRPVPVERVEAVEPYVSKQVWAIIRLQLLTGARGGELFRLRPADINRDGESGIWTHTPIEHKTAYLQRSRLIMFGCTRPGTQAHCTRRRCTQDRSGHDAATACRCHPLEHQVSGEAFGHQSFDGSQGLAGQQPQAALGANVQAQQRSALCREAY